MTDKLNVLVVEDEPLITMMIEDYIDLLGHSVAGVADSCVEGVRKVEAGGIDVAILDVNQRDGACWPVADALQRSGVPFVLATGGHVDPPPGSHVDAPQLAKPFTLDGVRAALEQLAQA